MYEEFSANYDRFMDWSARLAAELPFIKRQLSAVGAQRVLDAACGTGHHAIALAEAGYRVMGADLSPGMIDQARANALAIGATVRFRVAGFGQLAERVEGSFDALLCLGNSLPHVLTADALARTLADFASSLRPGGLLLIQNRNFDAVMAERQRWMAPQSHQEDDAEWLFLRFYDFETDGTLTFNLVTLRRSAGEQWEQTIASTRLRPLRQAELVAALEVAGFERITWGGDLEGGAFDPVRSPNLIAVARRPG
ncbi:MAG: methyltransferase domain-containing protein [Anaerolineae bacterium]|jgi:SAM-dependent methyltransferase